MYVYNIPFFSINDIKDTTRLKPWPLWLQLQGTLSSEFDPPHPAPHCMCPHSWPSQMSLAWPQVFQITRGENTGAGWRVTCDMRIAPELRRTIPSPIRTIAHDSAMRTHYNCTFPHSDLVHWPQVPWMKVVKVNDAGLSVGVKVSLIELIKLSSWVMIIIWLDCDCSEALLLAKCIMMTITAACHWLLCQSPEILCQLNVVFISQEWVISPWNHRVIKLVTLVSRQFDISAVWWLMQLTDIKKVKEPPNITERGRNFERFSWRYILSLDTGGSSSLSMWAFVERASILSSSSVWMINITTQYKK